MEKRIERAVEAVRRALLALASDETLYLFFAFLFAGVLNSSVFVWQREAIELLSSYVLIPWGAVLCVLRFQRANARTLMQADTALLTLLFAWAFAPFFLRFGVTFNNVTSWQGHASVCFAIYAMTREEEKARRDAMLDRLCALMAALSFVFAGALLACAAAVQGVMVDPKGEVFGENNGCLQSGVHYNHTGMTSVCMLMLCIAGACRRKSLPGKLLHGIPAAMMTLVVVLTQSRTARYSVLLAFAVGTYSALQAVLPVKKAALRHGAAIAAAALVLAAGYLGAGALTDAALNHYNGTAPVVAQAAAEETGAQEAPAEAAPQQTLEARQAVDATFSDRTTIWKNLIELWKNDPKYMVIGNGIGRTGSRIVKGTIHEEAGAVAVHNTYLQLVADFGLVGAGITLAFFLTVFFPALRVFFAAGEKRYAGGAALCMLVVACLATGMMESQPLGMMTPMNMMLYYALAVLCAEGRAMKR